MVWGTAAAILNGMIQTIDIKLLFGLLVFAGVAGFSACLFAEQEDFSTDVVQQMTGVPGEIVASALENGGLEVYLHGNKVEKHRFGKGLVTRYGQLPLNADDFLKYKKGWSESQIHKNGHRWGFSGLRPGAVSINLRPSNF